MAEKYVSRHLASAKNTPEKIEKEPYEQRTEGKRKNWLKGLVIWACVLLLLGAAACAVFYRYAQIYEISRPELVMDELLEQMTEEEFLTEARNAISLDITEFEDAETLFDDYYQSADLSGKLSYRSALASTSADQAVFTVRDGIHNICTVTLVPKSNLGFGRHEWQLGEISSANFLQNLASTEVILEAPSDTELYVNGVQVSSAYLVSTGNTCPIEDSVESKFSSDIEFAQYNIGKLYGEISARNGEGDVLTLSADSTESRLRFIDESTATITLSVSAPEDVRISLNGYTLTEEDVASRSLGILENLSDTVAEAAYLTNTYSFSGLYAMPQVTATDADGNLLEPIVVGEGEFHYFHANDPTLEAEAKETAESFFDAYTAYCSTKYDATLYQRIINRVARHSTLYEYFANSYDVMLWATSTQTEYNELTFGNFSYVGEDCYVCTVQYQADLTSTSWYEEYSYGVQNAYEIAFVRSDSKWLAAEMTSISG